MSSNLKLNRTFLLSTILTVTSHFAPAFLSPAQAQVPDHDWIQGKPPIALTRQARYFLEAETKYNPIAENRSAKPFWISHLEIPLEFVQKDAGRGLDPKILESMTFEKDGHKYVRWILNPEDNQFNEELRQKLVDLDIPFKQSKHYIGYLTSSRSCIVQDPNTGVIFSIKSSTNQTAGNWKSKQETPRAARLGRLLSDYLIENSHEERHQELGIVKEPLSFSFGPADQAIIVRQYDNFNEISGKYLVPLFAIFHEEFGRDLAEDNGALDAEKFWFETLGKSTFSKLVAKLVLEYGITFNSPHGQNFLVEIDSQRRPTGKIFVRDYGDAIFFAPVLRAQGGTAILEHIKGFKNNWTTEDVITLAFNPFYSGRVVKPSWIQKYDDWKQAFETNGRGILRSLLFANKKSNLTHAENPIWHSYWNVETANVSQAQGYRQWMNRLTRERSTRVSNMCKALFTSVE